jgi:hypothetical protein
MKKANSIAMRLLVIMSQNYSTDYTAPKGSQLTTLVTGVQTMLETGIKFTRRVMELLTPEDLDKQADSTYKPAIRRAEQRTKLRMTDGAEMVMATLMDIRVSKMPEPDVQHPRCQLMLDMPRPANVSIARLMEYVATAVGCWSGQFNPNEDPLFGFASNEKLNPISVRPVEFEDKLPRSVEQAVKRVQRAHKALQGLEQHVSKARAALKLD